MNTTIEKLLLEVEKDNDACDALYELRRGFRNVYKEACLRTFCNSKQIGKLLCNKNRSKCETQILDVLVHTDAYKQAYKDCFKDTWQLR